MANHLFIYWVITSTCIGSLIALFLTGIKSMFREKINPRWHYLLWMILFIKLLFPYEIQALNFSDEIVGLYESWFEQISYESIKTNEIQLSNHDRFWNLPKNYSLSVEKNMTKLPIELLGYVWSIGAGFVLSLFLILKIQLLIFMHNTRPIHDKAIMSIFFQCQEKLHVDRRIGLQITDRRMSPAIYGLIKPKIILPIHILEGRINEQQLHHIFLHELFHYKRKDLFINDLILIFQIINWFNPLLWYSFYRIRRDQEIACDFSVLNFLGIEETRAYGETMLHIIEMLKCRTLIPVLSGFSNNHSYIKKRLLHIIEFKKSKRSKAVYIVVVLILFSTVVLSAKSAVVPNGPLKVSAIKEKIIRENYQSYFNGFEGSFVLLDVSKEIYHIYNEDNSVIRSSPDSTFKPFGTLIALDTHIIDQNTSMVWDGTIYQFTAWNKDQSLKTAMQYSVNWYFEEVFNQIDEEQMKTYLSELQYGNQDISGGLKSFWNEASLEISPLEQVVSLKKLKEAKIESLESIWSIYKNSDVSLYGKTGTGIVNDQYIQGWFIGYLEMNQNRYLFATRIQSDDGADGKTAMEITEKLLETSLDFKFE